MRNLVLLAKLLNVSLDWLLSGVETASELKTIDYQTSDSDTSATVSTIDGLGDEQRQLLLAFNKLSDDWQGKVVQILQILAETHGEKKS